MSGEKYDELLKKYKRLKMSHNVLVVYALLSLIIILYNMFAA